MDLVGAIIAGLIGTAVMTILMYMAPAMGLPKMDVMGMLGTMFTETPSSARGIGAVMHFLMGAVFTLVYAGLWSAELGNPTAGWGILYGLVHGVIAILATPMMMRMHPRPPRCAPAPPQPQANSSGTPSTAWS
ncbi:hypothetical protein [Marinithermus hydrothermalis]|uniref:DUF2938 domain-containing protein n=1 Tax=Marinithermus hydrothermalis (strain DSM 14884 / JCM 11576 / T1) TaxID=869210 RepID=F2NNN1_MARHT|nr:hypothetical protein [Marinithermus hydrothermalis]AEB11046.1 hypothetical protein Marky_0289 [Marinithermus hydrothermalis DSM 14884]